MRKGFIFTSDALFAVLAVIALVSAMIAMQSAEKGKEKAFETVAQQARDKALVGTATSPGFYFGGTESDSTAALQDKQYYYCTNIVYYEPLVGQGQQFPDATKVHKKCEAFPK